MGRRNRATVTGAEPSPDFTPPTMALDALEVEQADDKDADPREDPERWVEIPEGHEVILIRSHTAGLIAYDVTGTGETVVVYLTDDHNGDALTWWGPIQRATLRARLLAWARLLRPDADRA